MAKQKDLWRVKLPIKANTPEKLTQAMIKNNVQDDREYDYTDIQRVGNIWIAWYYKSLRNVE